MLRHLLPVALLVVTASAPSGAPTAPYTSARLLLLRSTSLPKHFQYLEFTTFTSLQVWDAGNRGAEAIDRAGGWTQAAQELFLDPTGHYGGTSVSLFRTRTGARSVFQRLYTNAHPLTRFLQGERWLGGTSTRHLGHRATLYHVFHQASSCPGHLISGLALVYRNAVLDVNVCRQTAGDADAHDIALRMLQRARWLQHHPGG